MIHSNRNETGRNFLAHSECLSFSIVFATSHFVAKSKIFQFDTLVLICIRWILKINRDYQKMYYVTKNDFLSKGTAIANATIMLKKSLNFQNELLLKHYFNR